MRPRPVRLDRRAGASRAGAAGLVRDPARPRPADSPLLDLASNDYLGLARHPEVTEGRRRRPRARWGAGATGSRLVTGTTELHAELERELADVLRLRGGPGLLLRLRGQPRRRHRAHRPRLADRLRRGQPRLAHRRLPAVPRRDRRSSPHADPDAVRKALGRARRAAPSPSPTRSSRSTATPPRWPDSPPPAGSTAPALRRRRRARAGRARRRRPRRARTPPGSRARPTSSCTRHAVQVAGQPGRSGPRPGPGHRAPGQRGPHVHLRHRPRPGRRGRRPRAPCGCCAASPSAPARARAVAPRAARSG